MDFIKKEVADQLLKSGVLVYDINSKEFVVSESYKSTLWELSLGFNHVAIKQKKNLCNSRLEVDISSEIIKGVRRPVPLIAANMSSVCNADFCIQLYKLGALGVMHRALPDDEMVHAVSTIARSCDLVAASVGSGESQVALATKLVRAGANIIFIDIAHGYSDSVIETGRKIKKEHPDVKIVVGNTTNIDLLKESADFADCIKLGIAQGYACETKNTAGCTEGQFSAILKFKEISKQLGIPVISDGGVREPADLVKAIGAGANSVMAGSVFARCPESAAEVDTSSGKIMKVYFGMASRIAQEKWRGGLKDGTCPEGGVRYLPLGESLKDLLNRWSGALKSGITYAGGKDIKTFQENVEFIRIA